MTNVIAWVYMILAILTEVAGTTSMKLSQGFTQLLPSLLIFIFYGISFACLIHSLRRLEIGFAYAIWSSLGTLLIFLIGVFFFQESLTLIKCISVALIIFGVVGLKQV